MKFKNIIFFFYLFFFFLFLIPSSSYCAYPKLISTLNNAFTKIEGWIINISTPVATVAIGSGLLMKKFSFGDEEKIRTGKRLISGSIFSYAFILCLDLILSTINALLG